MGQLGKAMMRMAGVAGFGPPEPVEARMPVPPAPTMPEPAPLPLPLTSSELAEAARREAAKATADVQRVNRERQEEREAAVRQKLAVMEIQMAALPALFRSGQK